MTSSVVLPECCRWVGEGFPFRSGESSLAPCLDDLQPFPGGWPCRPSGRRAWFRCGSVTSGGCPGSRPARPSTGATGVGSPPGVYDLSRLVPLTDRHELDRRRRQAAFLGALVHPGAVITGVCALVLYDLQGAPASIEPEVTFPNGSPRRSAAVRVRRVPLRRWVTTGDIALVTITDAFAQAVPTLGRRHAVALMDSARHQGRLSETELHQAHVRALARRGVHRTHAWWDESDPRAESPAETWARLACQDAGIPPDALQLRIVSPGGRLLARTDLAWLLPDGRWLLVEIDGREAHETPDALFNDRTRQNRILTDRTLMRRFTGGEAWSGTLSKELVLLLGAAGWRQSRPCPDLLQL